MRKKRVLFHTEYSELSSGYATYAKNLMERMYASGKYEVAEFAIYVAPEDQTLQFKPWKVYPIMPSSSDEHYKGEYGSSPLGQFGIFKFEEVCLDFKPDIVMSIFDYWYSSYIIKSPFRNFFKLIWMPTVDSEPQRPCWIDTYSLCDKTMAYSYFGKRVLEEQSSGRIKDVTVASPGIDEKYKPSQSKEELRKAMGIPQDAKIVLMVARNQLRKLIPDFLETLDVYTRKYGKKNKDLVDKTFFYIHTSNPDGGWDIPECIVRTGCAGNILTTYVCRFCNSISISIYSGIVCKCSDCNNIAMSMSSVGAGVPREALADIMSIADVGVLASIGEGFGMPIIEMKKVGLPVITVPYSAMEEQCVDIKCGEDRHLGGVPVKIDRMYTEASTMQRRAMFSKEDLAKKVYEVLTMKEIKYDILSSNAKRCVDTYFTWDRTAEIWMEEIDKMEISDNLIWDKSPPMFFEELEANPIPEEMGGDAREMVEWAAEMWYNHPYLTEFRKSEMIQSLIAGVDMIDQFNKTAFTLENLMGIFKHFISKHNFFESVRKRLFFDKGEKKEDEKEMGVMIL